MTIQTIVPPAAEIFTAAEMRPHLRLEADEADQDTVIDEYIAAARDKAESYLRRRLLTQTVRLTLNGFGSWHSSSIALPIAPVQSVSKVEYLDSAGVWQTVDPTAYRLIDSCTPKTLYPATGWQWPTPANEPANVHIDLVVGYGAAASDVPPAILQGIRLLVAHMFQNREGVIIGENAKELPLGVGDLLSDHRFWV
jgi:uncharacterized phiE125 gp8 family phage protein